MENNVEKKNPLNDLMRSAMEKVREMADTNAIVGQPRSFGGGSGAGVNIAPVAFLVIKDGITRVLPVAVPPVSTVDRVVEMVPDVLDRVEKFFDKKEDKDLE